MKILVTGASGYIGSRFVNYALSHNHHVISASRKPFKTESQWLPFDFQDLSSFSLPEQVDVVIHLAANTSTSENNGDDEISAARMLIAQAREINARVIFISSQTARLDAPTNYGRIKWRIEQDVLAANGLVVRLGLVYGATEQGLFGTLTKLVKQLPVLPSFLPAPLVQPLHVDDCVIGLLKLAELKKWPSDRISLGAAKAISFTAFLKSISQNRIRSPRLFIPAPIAMVTLGSKIIGPKLTAKFGLDRLKSLFDLPLMNTQSDLKKLDLGLRTLSSGMQRSGCDRRRRLIQEGVVLLTYLLKTKPNSILVRRYVRGIESLRSGQSLPIPAWLLGWPAGIALLDQRSSTQSLVAQEFAWRIDAATVIAEASKQGAVRFLGDTQARSALAILVQMAITVGSELGWRLLSLLIPSTLLGFATVTKT